MTTPGLSYFEGGGSADAPSAADTDNRQDIGGGALVKATGKGLSPVGNISMDAAQTAELLANMQGMIDQRTGAANELMRGLERAAAWGSGGVQGPSQALATLNAQQQREDESVFNMRQQMAAYKAAQTQQDRLNQELGSLTGGGGGYEIPPEIQKAIKLAGTGEEKKKVFTDWAKENAKAYAQPDMDKPTIPVLKFDQSNNEWIPDMVSPRQYRTGSYRDTPQTAAALPVSTGTAPTLASIQRGVFGQESSSGTVDTSKPNYAGAIGPMQMLPETFEGLKKEGIIPSGYDINNPVHNRDAGNKLLEKYYKQYNGDTDKTLAAYYGGPGAVNKDGTINTDWKDKLNPNAPTVGQYIAQVKQRSNLVAAPTQPTTIPPRPVSTQAAQQAQEVAMAGQKKGAEITAEASRKEQETFKDRTDITNVGFQAQTAADMKAILKELGPNSKMLNSFNTPGMASAIGQLLTSGITTPIGAISMPGFNRAVLATKPGVTERELKLVDEFDTVTARLEAAVAQANKGQGTTSDAERVLFKKIGGSSLNSYEMLERAQQALEIKANFNKQAGDLMKNIENQTGKEVNWVKFRSSPEYRSLEEKYVNDLASISKSIPQTSGANRQQSASHPGAALVDQYLKAK